MARSMNSSDRKSHCGFPDPLPQDRERDPTLQAVHASFRTDKERNKLVKFGSKLGKALGELVTIVHPDTLRTAEADKARKKPKRKKDRDVVPVSQIECRQRLGGLLKHYSQKAA